MGKRIELTIQLENNPGTLANLGDALGKAKVNILAFMADEVGGQSKVRLVTDNPAKAKKTMAGQNLAGPRSRSRWHEISQQTWNTGGCVQ
jgi:hypothetical protein